MSPFESTDVLPPCYYLLLGQRLRVTAWHNARHPLGTAFDVQRMPLLLQITKWDEFTFTAKYFLKKWATKYEGVDTLVASEVSQPISEGRYLSPGHKGLPFEPLVTGI